MENELETLKTDIETLDLSAKLEEVLVENEKLLQDMEDYEAEIKDLEIQVKQVQAKLDQLPSIDKSIYALSEYFRIPPNDLIQTIYKLEKAYRDYQGSYIDNSFRYVIEPSRTNTVLSPKNSILTSYGP